MVTQPSGQRVSVKNQLDTSAINIHLVCTAGTLTGKCRLSSNIRFKTHPISKLKRFSSRPAVVFAQSIPIHWSQILSREWRCSWSNAARRCSNYISVACKASSYIQGVTVCKCGMCISVYNAVLSYIDVKRVSLHEFGNIVKYINIHARKNICQKIVWLRKPNT